MAEALVALPAGGYAITVPLTFATVSAVREFALPLIEQASASLSFDLLQVQRVDSAGLALLIDWLALARARNCRLSYREPSEALLALARLSDVEQLIRGDG